ncbi:hypothetical protein TNCV_4653321 [Trichonephila clavipes]|nr:hypothetical protein TNCV_4653321 [Trichonephila clavipes]
MSVQRFGKLEEALELLNSLVSDESDIEITVLPDVSELNDEDEGEENEVNTGVRLLQKWFLGLWRREVEIEREFPQPEPPTSFNVLTTKCRKIAKRHQLSWTKNKSRPYQKGKHRLNQLKVTCPSRWKLH